jgi:hypothetical protein
MLFVLIAAAAIAIWVVSTRYAAEIRQVDAPDGQRYDLLVHREGVPLFSPGAAAINLGAPPTLLALWRRWRRGPWNWAVTLRWSPFGGQVDLLHEVVGDPERARARADEIAEAIRGGRWAVGTGPPA